MLTARGGFDPTAAPTGKEPEPIVWSGEHPQKHWRSNSLPWRHCKGFDQPCRKVPRQESGYSAGTDLSALCDLTVQLMQDSGASAAPTVLLSVSSQRMYKPKRVGVLKCAGKLPVLQLCFWLKQDHLPNMSTRFRTTTTQDCLFPSHHSQKRTESRSLEYSALGHTEVFTGATLLSSGWQRISHLLRLLPNSMRS